MGLIKCVDCLGDVSYKAVFCPRCGRIINEKLVKEILSKSLFENKQEELEKIIKENYYDNKIKEEKRLDTIRKILYENEENKLRGLECFTPIEDGVIVTDGCQLYKLNDKCLPFDVGFMHGVSDRRIKRYAEYYGTKVRTLYYPDITKFINVNTDEVIDTVRVDLELFLNEYTSNVLLGLGDDDMMSFDTVEGRVCYDSNFLMNAINILKIDKDFDVMIYGKDKHIVIFNDKKEMAYILPILKSGS